MSDNHAVLRDVFQLLTGDKLGNGIARTVYECLLNHEWVVKVEEASRSFQNVIEWETWNSVRGTELEKWFAPCLHISPSGTVLVMARTTQVPEKKYPKLMPVFLTDFKRDNYGLYRGRVVCHDYGTNLLMEHGKSQRMRKPDWWR